MTKFYVRNHLHFYGRDGEGYFSEYDYEPGITLSGQAIYSLDDSLLDPALSIDLNNVIGELTRKIKPNRQSEGEMALKREAALMLIDTIAQEACGRCYYSQFRLGALYSLSHKEEVTALAELQKSIFKTYVNKEELNTPARYQYVRGRINNGAFDDKLHVLSPTIMSKILAKHYPRVRETIAQDKLVDVASRVLAQTGIHRIKASSLCDGNTDFEATVVSPAFLARHGRSLTKTPEPQLV